MSEQRAVIRIDLESVSDPEKVYGAVEKLIRDMGEVGTLSMERIPELPVGEFIGCVIENPNPGVTFTSAPFTPPNVDTDPPGEVSEDLLENLAWKLCPSLRAQEECDLPQILHGPHPECHRCRVGTERGGATAGCRLVANVVARAAISALPTLPEWEGLREKIKAALANIQDGYARNIRRTELLAEAYTALLHISALLGEQM